MTLAGMRGGLASAAIRLAGMDAGHGVVATWMSGRRGAANQPLIGMVRCARISLLDSRDASEPICPSTAQKNGGTIATNCGTFRRYVVWGGGSDAIVAIVARASPSGMPARNAQPQYCRHRCAGAGRGDHR